MFENRSGGTRVLVIAAALGLAIAVVAFVAPVREGAAILLTGNNPLGDPLPPHHTRTAHLRSPLTVGLELEASPHPGVLPFADEVARLVGRRALARSGSQISREGLEAIARDLALILQTKAVYELPSAHFFKDGPEATPRYLRANELVLLYAHVAWRLDLPFELMRAPDHLYLSWGVDKARIDVQPTCLWFEIPTDPTGHRTRPCPGRTHTMDPGYLATPTAGLRLPDPLPAKTWTAISPDALADLLRSRQAADERFGPRLSKGLRAVDAEDWDTVRTISSELDGLRVEHGEAWPAPDERVLRAALAFEKGKSGTAELKPVFAHYEPDGPVEQAKTEAHAVAMWLEMKHRSARAGDWNLRLIPLFNRYKSDPERFAQLCIFGDQALAGVEQTLGELMPSCP